MKQSDANKKYLTQPIYKFFIKQLLQIGLSMEENSFPYIREGMKSRAQYLSPDSNGNVRFFVPDPITKDLETYTTGKAPKVKIRDWYMTRWIKPLQTKDGLAKYTPIKGAGTRCLFTKPVIDAFEQKKQIKTLFIIEGFKKALSGAINGNLPMIGMNGLSGFKEPGEQNKIRTEIKQILNTCMVQRVVVIFDSDLFDLSKSKDKPASQRPNQFYRAALMARLLIEPFADVYLSYPNPSHSKKYGFDDLLQENRTNSKIISKLPEQKKKTEQIFVFPAMPDKQDYIIKDLRRSINSVSKTHYFTSHKLSAISDFKIKALFHLDNVQSFYEFYNHKLSLLPNKRFQYYTRLYQINTDGTLAETEADSTKHLNFESRFGKLGRMTDEGYKEIANFNIRVLFQIESKIDPKRICEIINYEGKKHTIEITSKTFVSLTEFQALLINYGDFIFRGTKYDLLDLMSALFKHEIPATLIDQLGHQPIDDFFSFSNGIVTSQGFMPVTKYGMVEHGGTNYYLPAWSEFNKRNFDDFKDVKKFAHYEAKKPASFKKWHDQFSTVYGDQGHIATTFYISTLFSDIVFNHKSGIGFPLLWAAGKPKTGKSTIMTSLLALFGKPLESIGLAGKSTAKYTISRFAQNRNSYVHLEEYSNSKVSSPVKEMLKNIYDRIGYGRKSFSNDYKTLTTPILSSALVSGEEIPTDNHALFTRAILLLFNKDKFTTKERLDFDSLRDMEEDSLTHITVEILMTRQLIEDNYNTTFETVFTDLFKLFKHKKFDDRMLKNSAWLITTVKILMDHKKIDFTITYQELLHIFVRNIDRQSLYMAANTDVSKFWDIVEMLHVRKELTEEAGDFRIIDDMIAIRINRFHHPYTLEARKLGYDKILDKSTLQNYLTNEPSFIENIDSNGKLKLVRFNGSTPTTAMFFDYAALNIDLKNNFNPNPNEHQTDEELHPDYVPPEPDTEELPDAEQTEMGF